MNFELTGETDDIFMIEKDGLLYYTKALDRETRAVHHLQVSRGQRAGASAPLLLEGAEASRKLCSPHMTFLPPSSPPSLPSFLPPRLKTNYRGVWLFD